MNYLRKRLTFNKKPFIYMTISQAENTKKLTKIIIDKKL
jgi:CMP-N-acetylneuraminic acid synthetase